MTLPFDLNNPPAEPPPGCFDPDKWREAYRRWQEHRPNPYGRCVNKLCEERFPCFASQLALRGLIDACVPKPQHQRLPGPGRIVDETVCRWCGQAIMRHSWVGWVHAEGGFILCQEPRAGVPPLTGAEP
jgi:hypothetical protein